ncbi:MAG: pyridoxamine 5'-phosphate oxidase family protein [Bacteroides sp.]|uniref:pyridoxamine 5'-phosphate oxidase family protein n=1 Tax=Bacteroides sp. TaxID=29523 RepID=UPI0025B9DA7A|nr:pyridoxamine 5'-phosphate oxidase family protein [Bacteroides sp.]MBS6237674.1 pyridoxamine 5'-phosphate oxidase family protein [Bacteroides sp.]
METMREKAAQMLRESEVVVLASVNKEGYPRPVPMSMVKSEDISTVWMSTGSFHAQGNSVCMTGDVEVITDQNVKQELWQDWFINHFPGGPTDPNYVILKFTANHATYWIDGKFIHKKV